VADLQQFLNIKLDGEITDGSPIAMAYLTVSTPDAQVLTAPLTLDGILWSYSDLLTNALTLTDFVVVTDTQGLTSTALLTSTTVITYNRLFSQIGFYQYWLDAVDAAGNWANLGPYTLDRRPPQAIYLPLVFRTYTPPPVGPDLMVEQLGVTPDTVTLTIKNIGNQPVQDAFWVDLYFDPAQPPEVNLSWPDLCEVYGATWLVDTLAAGESLTLTIGDMYYQTEYSQWPAAAYPAGTHEIWAYVDSWGDPALGAVAEANENNNRVGPEMLTITNSMGPTQQPQPTAPFLNRP
jgi:hypothetical protein